jgi:hypothetical protein
MRQYIKLNIKALDGRWTTVRLPQAVEELVAVVYDVDREDARNIIKSRADELTDLGRPGSQELLDGVLRDAAAVVRGQRIGSKKEDGEDYFLELELDRLSKHIQAQIAAGREFEEIVKEQTTTTPEDVMYCLLEWRVWRLRRRGEDVSVPDLIEQFEKRHEAGEFVNFAYAINLVRVGGVAKGDQVWFEQTYFDLEGGAWISKNWDMSGFLGDLDILTDMLRPRDPANMTQVVIMDGSWGDDSDAGEEEAICQK